MNASLSGSHGDPGPRRYLPDRRRGARDAERARTLETLHNLQIVRRAAHRCRCRQFATVRYELEQPLVWRRDRKPTITIQADACPTSSQPTTVVKQLQARRSTNFAPSLPVGYTVATGGTVEESGKAQAVDRQSCR